MSASASILLAVTAASGGSIATWLGTRFIHGIASWPFTSECPVPEVLVTCPAPSCPDLHELACIIQPSISCSPCPTCETCDPCQQCDTCSVMLLEHKWFIFGTLSMFFTLFGSINDRYILRAIRSVSTTTQQDGNIAFIAQSIRSSDCEAEGQLRSSEAGRLHRGHLRRPQRAAAGLPAPRLAETHAC